MKTVIYTISGLCAAFAGLLVIARREQPVVEMAHRLEAAWADHHTTV